MFIKTGLKKTINLLVALTAKTFIGRYIFSEIIATLRSQIKKISHNEVELEFYIPNTLSLIRVDTFSTKEPETLDWIDSMPEGSIVWDIGANIGLYACYAAMKKKCKVFAFEPSVFNLELLARNIFINELTELITIIPLPLSERLTASKLNMTSIEWGGALSTFDKSFGYDGQELRKMFEFTTVGLSMAEAVDILKIPKPDYIKMDVDGIEHLILKGGEELLLDVKSILVEINDNFKEQAEATERCLIAAGLHLTEKRCWQEDSNSLADTTFNQIWHRK